MHVARRRHVESEGKAYVALFVPAIEMLRLREIGVAAQEHLAKARGAAHRDRLVK